MTVTMLYIKSLDLIHLITDSFINIININGEISSISPHTTIPPLPESPILFSASVSVITDNHNKYNINRISWK